MMTIGGSGRASLLLLYDFVQRHFISYSNIWMWAAAMHPEQHAMTSASQLLIATGICIIEFALLVVRTKILSPGVLVELGQTGFAQVSSKISGCILSQVVLWLPSDLAGIPYDLETIISIASLLVVDDVIIKISVVNFVDFIL